MSAIELAIGFRCGGDLLQGVASLPRMPSKLGIVIVVGGPQYRVGSHRQFVHLARGLAGAGVAAFRFDVRGMGDSEGARRSFETLDDDICAAIDALQSTATSVERVVLAGLCDGASAALLYRTRRSDPRIAGLVLLNPWVRSAATEARTRVRHYYLSRLVDRRFWRKLITGGVSLSAVGELGSALRRMKGSPAARGEPVAYQDMMARAWIEHPEPLLLLSSDRDLTAREFDEAVAAGGVWQGAFDLPHVQRRDLRGADHTLSTPGAKDQALGAVIDWLHQHWPRHADV